MTDKESFQDVRERIPELTVWRYSLQSETETRSTFRAGTTVAEWMREEIEKNGYYAMTYDKAISGDTTFIYSIDPIPLETRRMWKLIGSVQADKIVER